MTNTLQWTGSEKQYFADSTKYDGKFWVVGEDVDGAWVVELLDTDGAGGCLTVVASSNAAFAAAETDEGSA